MSTIVIMPGGFHPFHAGHAALYNSAQRAFPDAEVFVAATNDTSTRPFPFAVKEKLAKLAGVDAGHFVQVKSPFQAKEITSRFDPEKDHLIFVRSEKDADKPPLAGGVKKDGNPSYLQPLLGATRLEPFSKRAYMAYLPTVEFGPDMTSATEIRTAWPTLNEKRKTALVMSLYPATQKNPKLAANVVAMLDTAIGNELEESKMIDAKMIDVFYRPDPHSRARRVVARNIPAAALDQLLEKLSDKFGVSVDNFEWEETDSIDEMDGQNFVGGMTASYQARENQPVDEDYLPEKATIMLINEVASLEESSGASLEGSFTRDLVFSKFWIMHELAQIQPRVSTMYVLGSWYGNLALYLNRYPQVRVDHIINVETDPERLDTGARMLDQAGALNVEHMLTDANQLDYRQLGRDGVVVNTSLTEMTDTDWFKNIPPGILVVMQARDQVDDEQFTGPADIAQKFPLDQVLYSGSLDLEDPETAYTRFMVIGRK